MGGGVEVRRITDDDDPFAVRRDMGEPVVIGVVGDLFLGGAIRVHAPDLHFAGAGGEIDVAAIGSVFGSVIQAGGIGEADLRTAAIGRDLIDVVFIGPAAGEDEEFSIG